MTERLLDELHRIPSFSTAIISSVSLYKANNMVEVCVTTDKTYSDDEEILVKKSVKKCIPEYFSFSVKISKLTPDEGMVAKKIFEAVQDINKQLAALLTPADVHVERVDGGFFFTLSAVRAAAYTSDTVKQISAKLQKCFCGTFNGRLIESENKIEDFAVEEKHENEEYEIPPRMFSITGFSPIESSVAPTHAVYIADLNFVSDKVAICGQILDVKERAITGKSGKEKPMFNFLINDTTASIRVSYFSRAKSVEKIRNLKAGDSVILTCKTELYRGMVRPTAMFVDIGMVPPDFVPEKRQSKPVPKYYETVFPEPYVDFTQDNFFSDTTLPDCLTENNFVVFDLETTGLTSSPSGGSMDRIIEIGAYKIVKGEIKESFSTFVNPERRLSQEITNLTGIDEDMVRDAPTYAKVMPDFFKFIDGCYLVGHNAANFDFKFIDYYCTKCGYVPERKLFDTIPLSQQMIRLSNYKLNTVADYFHITFNHHRAVDDALATAKIFIELIKLKKSLPTLC